MKRAVICFVRRFKESSDSFLIVGLFIMLSCKKEIPSILDSILGDYTNEYEVCPNHASLLDVGSRFAIKKTSNSLANTIEIHFESTRGSIWYGQLKTDTLYFPKQIVATTNPDYPPGPNEITGFAVVKGDIIEFKIEEFYTANKYIQVCTFSGKRK